LSRPEDYITADDIKQLIAELRSKRGRLLLNVGPDMNGQIPSAQLSILQQLSDR
ncbi:alpha-L-fucosidase, partial [Lacticaseibacillus paracasei]